MPTVFSHIAVPLVVGLGLGPQAVPRRLLLAGVVASVLPDADVAGMHHGWVDYADALGHRGVSHSLAFAAGLGALAAWGARRWLGCAGWVAFLFVALCAASHGLLDMCTDGGRGVALFWPFTDERLFFHERPIAVSPIGLKKLLTERGLRVGLSELLWVWVPAAAVFAGLRLATLLTRGRTAR